MFNVMLRKVNLCKFLGNCVLFEKQIIASAITSSSSSSIIAANQNIRSISTKGSQNNSAECNLTTKNPPGIPRIELLRQQKFKKIPRTLTTINHSVPIAARATVSKDECRDFMAVFPDLVRDLTEYTSKFDLNDSKTSVKWFAKALQYNVPNGKKNRGLATVLTYKQLINDSHLTSENIRLAQYLGWCVEMLQSMFLIADDVMDGSLTRRGQPCWYKLDDVGMIAVNDCLMIENGLYYILRKYFGQKDYYTRLIELFHEVVFITTVGQSLDLHSANKDVTTFTMDKYKSIVLNKTAYYTFYLPVASAMYMAGFTDPEVFRQAKTILLEMGYFFQVQDDFIDCFGDPSLTGKIGTDIQDNKCSWLAVVCMQRASEEQKQIMRECYAQNDPVKVARVKELYKELGLPQTYLIYEQETYNMIKTHIQQTSRGIPHEIFLKILDKIYQRDS